MGGIVKNSSNYQPAKSLVTLTEKRIKKILCRATLLKTLLFLTFLSDSWFGLQRLKTLKKIPSQAISSLEYGVYFENILLLYWIIIFVTPSFGIQLIEYFEG